ncbi:GNAT family N-acetyltransferase [Lichenibacterium minor]|uniref:GNAT family N-acetyltransferase n=1 Tax=Lichenibacterium minor TaxID=2316528 RepID=A0A4Q2UFA4_9HYPH|nr:GNAT family N-acetyltransferase [Lichenibacterium minor]RYC33907.1 GNAT family N-acetyltransferase [Lichenibacterium minor]
MTAREAGFAVDRLDAADAVAHRDAWADLVGRALEPNVFLDPDFALPAAQHLAGRRKPGFVLVWAVEAGERRDLVAVCPVVGRRGPLKGLASAWIHNLSTLGFPLLDGSRAAAALRALLAWAGEALPGACGLVVPSLPMDGPTAAALRDVAADGGLDLVQLRTWERAALRRGGRAGPAALSPKAAKEIRRQRRRLAERGALSYTGAEAPDAVRAGIEQFLSLEAGGWKGAAGTALLSRPGTTAFLRAATRMLARRGLCRVDSLTLDGAPVAMAVTLSAGDVGFLWKIAYREDVARFSPGVQLVLELTEAWCRRGGAGTMDSCAVPDHPMIDRLWKDRIRLCDVAVALRPGRAGAFRRAVGIERAARRLRAEAKRLLSGWRARRAASRR